MDPAHNEGEPNSNVDELAGSEFANLFSVIDRDNVHGLNLSVPEDARAVIKPWNEREDTSKLADSGVDDQLVIHVPFVQNVKVKSILLKTGRGEYAPRHLRIYANSTNVVDFTEAESRRPEYDIRLQEGEVTVTEYPLRSAVFANIHSLSLHLGDAVGEEVSRVYYIGFRGSTRTVKKEATQKLEIPAANAADAPLANKMSERVASQQSTTR